MPRESVCDWAAPVAPVASVVAPDARLVPSVSAGMVPLRSAAWMSSSIEYRLNGAFDYRTPGAGRGRGRGIRRRVLETLDRMRSPCHRGYSPFHLHRGPLGKAS